MGRDGLGPRLSFGRSILGAGLALLAAALVTFGVALLTDRWFGAV